jgi:hypothetical protein
MFTKKLERTLSATLILGLSRSNCSQFYISRLYLDILLPDSFYIMMPLLAEFCRIILTAQARQTLLYLKQPNLLLGVRRTSEPDYHLRRGSYVSSWR